MIGAVLGLLTSGLGRYVAIAGVVLALAGAAIGVLVVHDSSVRGDLVAEQTAAQAVANAAQHQRVVAVLGAAFVQQRDAAEAMARTLGSIFNAPSSLDCVGSPAAGSWLRSLDAPATGGGTGSR